MMFDFSRLIKQMKRNLNDGAWGAAGYFYPQGKSMRVRFDEMEELIKILEKPCQCGGNCGKNK